MTRPSVTLCVIGGFLMAFPGLWVREARASWLIPLGVGLTLLIIAGAKAGWSRPRTVTLVLVTLNSSFWLSFLLWRLRTRFFGFDEGPGLDPFLGPVAGWALLLLSSIAYYVLVFLRAWVGRSEERGFLLVGIAGLVLQVLVTMRFIWEIIQGV